MIDKLKRFFPYESLILLLIFILYALTAPYTVQSGDTGELVTNSYFLRVAHPPGYPLATLLYHFPTRYLPLKTPFHSAGIFTAFITVLWLGILIFRFRNKESIALVLVLATSLFFWRYALLPDVFSLHMLFLTLVFIVFIQPRLLEKPWIIFLVSLSVANHHTIVFFFPLYLYAVFQQPSGRKFFYSLLFGIISMSLYGLLLFFHPEEYGSWGRINTFQELVTHFLRKEYGTFNLHDAPFSGLQTSWLHLMMMNLLTNCWSLLLVIAYILIKHIKKLKQDWIRYSILLASTAGYLITFLILLSSFLSMDLHGEAVFERFLLQPILGLFFMALIAINQGGIRLPQWLLMSVLVNAGLNVTQNFKVNDYRHNTVIEDYALNIYNSLPANSIYYSLTDIQGGAAYYLHDVLKVRPDIIHLHANLNFSWSAEKAQREFPEAFNFNKKVILEGINFEKYRFFLNVPPVTPTPFFKLTYHGLAFELTPSSNRENLVEYNCDVSRKFEWRSRSTLESFSQFEISHYFDLEFGRCYYTQGLDQLEKNNPMDARISLEKAMELSPYSAKFLERLCFVYKELKHSKQTECEERLEELLSVSNQQYYLNKY